MDPYEGPFSRFRRPGEKNYKRCVQCGEPCPGRRTSYCSNACVHEWRLRTDPGYMRACVFDRDQGVCALCGRDCHELRIQVKNLWNAFHDDGKRQNRLWSWLVRWKFHFKVSSSHVWDGKSWEKRLVAGIPGRFRVTKLVFELHLASVWQADHIQPVVEGGGLCGLENLATLCLWCHRRKTSEQARRRAHEKRNVRREKSTVGGGSRPTGDEEGSRAEEVPGSGDVRGVQDDLGC